MKPSFAIKHCGKELSGKVMPFDEAQAYLNELFSKVAISNTLNIIEHDGAIRTQYTKMADGKLLRLEIMN